MIYFDIGCNSGQWIAERYNLVDTFIGVEPNPKTFNKALERFKDNKNVFILNCAVSDKSGEIDFYPEIYDPSAVASTASRFWIEKGRFAGVCGWPEAIKVKAITLDDLIAEYGMPVHIKIDVEGYEINVLKGLTQTVPSLSFEYTEELKSNVISCVYYLEGLGFTKFSITETDKVNPDYAMIAGELVRQIHYTFDETKKELWGMIYAYV